MSYIKIKHGNIFYRKYGSSKLNPLIALHDGLGLNSIYLEGLSKLSKERQIILFDQVGSRSSDTTDKRKWTTKNHVEVFSKFVDQLHLQNDMTLSHSHIIDIRDLTLRTYSHF